MSFLAENRMTVSCDWGDEGILYTQKNRNMHQNDAGFIYTQVYTLCRLEYRMYQNQVTEAQKFVTYSKKV